MTMGAGGMNFWLLSKTEKSIHCYLRQGGWKQGIPQGLRQSPNG